MKKLIWIILLVIVLALVGVVFARSQTPTQRRVTCVLKTTNGTWSVLDDAYHDNEGCGTITQTSTYIKIPYARFDTIVGNSIEEDGRLLIDKIMAGGSIGTSYSCVAFVKDGVQINPATITHPAANIFYEVIGNDYE